MLPRTRRGVHSGPVRVNPRASTWANLAVLGVVVAGAWWLGSVRVARINVPLAAPRLFGEVSVALPEGFALLASESSGKRGLGMMTEGALFIAAERDAAGLDVRGATFVRGGRALTVSLLSPAQALPPAKLLDELYGTRPEASRPRPLALGGHPGQIDVVAYEPRAAEGSTDAPGERGRTDGPAGLRAPPPPPGLVSFRAVAVATLPSGRSLVLRLEGPGLGTEADLRLLERVAERVAVTTEPAPSPGLDPLTTLRYRKIAPPPAVPDPVAATASPAPRRHTGQTLVLPDPDTGAVSTVEVFGLPLPPPDPADESGGLSVLRALAATSEPAMLDAKAARLSPSRVLLTLERPATYPVRVLFVWTEAPPDTAAMLVARGPAGGENALPRLLNSVADRLNFAPHDPAQPPLTELVARGRALARVAESLETPDPVRLLFREGEALVGWTLIDPADAARVESRRVPRPESPIARALRTATPSPGGLTQIRQTRQFYFPDDDPRSPADTAGFVDALAGVSFTLSPPPAPGTPDLPAQLSDPAARPDLLSRSLYLPSHRLLAALPSLGEHPALVVTDALPLLDLDALPRLWFVQLSTLASGPDGTRAVLLQPLGTGRALVARYDRSGALRGLDVVGGPRGTLPTTEGADLPATGPLAP